MLGNSAYLDVGSNNACKNCVISAVSKAHSSGSTSIIYCLKLNAVGEVEGHPFRLSRPDFRFIWDNDELNDEEIQFGSVVKYVEVGREYLYVGNTKRPRMDADFIQRNLTYGESAFRGIREAFPDAKIPYKGKGIYQNCQPSKRSASLVAIKYGDIKNERISFVTKCGELLDLKLNCRANLVMSTSPVQLQIRAVEDDDEVGDVALIRMGDSECSLRNPTYQGVCEGLILKYKPQTISIKGEPVWIEDGDGNVIMVPGRVLFDSGNDAGTAISEKLCNTLGLEPDSRKKIKVFVPGGDVNEFKTVTIKLLIRKRPFTVDALVGAVTEVTDLLVGMEIIKQLSSENFTLGI